MILKTVNSTAIHAIGYEPEHRVMEIIFNNGGIYRYTDVPRQVFEGMLNSESKGAFFQQHVRGRFSNWRLGRWRRRWERAGSNGHAAPQRHGTGARA